jgi:hypothetical protein
MARGTGERACAHVPPIECPPAGTRTRTKHDGVQAFSELGRGRQSVRVHQSSRLRALGVDAFTPPGLHAPCRAHHCLRGAHHCAVLMPIQTYTHCNKVKTNRRTILGQKKKKKKEERNQNNSNMSKCYHRSTRRSRSTEGFAHPITQSATGTFLEKGNGSSSQASRGKRHNYSPPLLLLVYFLFYYNK